jgi:hypothetical protein
MGRHWSTHRAEVLVSVDAVRLPCVECVWWLRMAGEAVTCWVLLELLDGSDSILGVYTDHGAAINALSDLRATDGCHYRLEQSEITEHTPWVNSRQRAEPDTSP